MNDSRQSGFRIGVWDVFPVENRLKGPERECVLEPKVMDVLVHLAQHQGEVVSRQQLLDAVWPDVVVGEEVVSRAISVLRSQLGDDQKHARYLKTISKRGYCLVADVTPLTPSEPQGSGALNSVRKRSMVMVALVLLAAGYFGYKSFSPQPGIDEVPEDVARSIAVLPFVNLSDDARNEYFSDGITEELLNQLSRIQGLRVISRTSSFSLRQENLDISAVAERLNVAFVLEGSVRKDDGIVRISAQLIDARADSHLWSNVYERELENIFEVQEEVSAAIFNALQPHLGLQADAMPPMTTAANIEAHEAYLRGRYLMRQATYATDYAAIQEFETALSHDPDFALAHADLAMALPYHAPENLDKAHYHAERAMALNPELAESQTAAAVVLWRQEEWEQSLARLQRAVQLNPNYVMAYVHMGNLLGWKLGRYEESFEMRAISMRLDPLSVPTISYYVDGLIERNRLDEVDQLLEKIATIFPKIYAYRRGSRLAVGGNIAEAVLGSLEPLRIDPTFPHAKNYLAFRLAALGLEKEALAIAHRPYPRFARYFGKPDLALEIAERDLAENPDSLVARSDFGLALAGTGDFARAKPYLEEMWVQSGGRISRSSDIFHTLTAVALIAARRHAGDEDGIGELVEAILDNVRRYHEAGIVGGLFHGPDYEEGLALYLNGDREKGLALLDFGMQRAVFLPLNEAYLQPIYDDPGFAPLRARQEARRDRERKKVLEIVCTNNPYAAVWEPADGTCERFVARSTN